MGKAEEPVGSAAMAEGAPRAGARRSVVHTTRGLARWAGEHGAGRADDPKDSNL